MRLIEIIAAGIAGTIDRLHPGPGPHPFATIAGQRLSRGVLLREGRSFP